MKSKATAVQIAVPLTQAEQAKLNRMRESGIMKGRWVAEAIREKLAREESKAVPA